MDATGVATREAARALCAKNHCSFAKIQKNPLHQQKNPLPQLGGRPFSLLRGLPGCFTEPLRFIQGGVGKEKTGAPCAVSVGKDKNRKNPLQRMGLRPAVRLPLWSYKSKLLTPKLKACQHLLTEGIHPLQGDKQK